MIPIESIRSRLWHLSVLSLLIIAVSYPRFNRQDVGFLNGTAGDDKLSFTSDKGIAYTNLSWDAQQYLLLVKYFRNPTSENKSACRPPFSYRPLAPFIAAQIPFDEMTSLNLLNVFSLILGLFFLELIISTLGVAKGPKYFTLLFFAVSFPTFYYGAIAYIDPFFIFLLTLGTFLLINEKWFVFPLLILLGVFAKEGIVILLPVAVVSLFTFTRQKLRAIHGTGLAIAAFLFGTMITRTLFPENTQFLWTPSYGALLMNLLRNRSWISILISFGIPGIISIMVIFRALQKHSYNQIPFFFPLLTGLVISILFCIFGFVTVNADGRYIWPSYVFCIPLMSMYKNRLW